jgi:hypothetical protein
LFDLGLETAGFSSRREEVVGGFDPLADVVGGTRERLGQFIVVEIEPVEGESAHRLPVLPPLRFEYHTIHRGMS